MLLFTNRGITPPLRGDKLLSLSNSMEDIEGVETVTTTIYKVTTSKCSFLVGGHLQIAVFKGDELSWLYPQQLTPDCALVPIHTHVLGGDEEDTELSWAKGFTYYNYTFSKSDESIRERMIKLHKKYGLLYKETVLSNSVVMDTPLKGARPRDYFQKNFNSRAAYVAGLFDNLGEGKVVFPMREEDMDDMRLLLQSISVQCNIVSNGLWYSPSKIEVSEDTALFQLGQSIRRYSSRWVQTNDEYPTGDSSSPALCLNVQNKGTGFVATPITKALNFIAEGFLVRKVTL